VAGSNAHAANINVVGPLTLPSALTLQNGGGGNINLGGALTAIEDRAALARQHHARPRARPSPPAR
jgi:hypothetical protein